MPSDRPPLSPLLSLLLALASLALFPAGILVMERTRAWVPALKVALPAMALAAAGLAAGVAVLRTRPAGKTYGLAMTGGITGAFSILFWGSMVPMLLIIAYPARQADPGNPPLEQSRKQMVILVRHIKTFERDHDRLPVRLEELVSKGYTPSHLLYDPRQKRRDAPSYRLQVQELPPRADWGRIPILEGRIPDAEGFRLSAYADETTGLLPPPESHAP